MDYDKARKEMVRLQLRERGIRDDRLLKAMGQVAREDFLSEEGKKLAYIDSPLRIPCGQTISQPYILARLLELLKLKGGEEVLEVGTGSGYSTALLSLLAGHVVSVERSEILFRQARKNLNSYMRQNKNIELILGDGSLGYGQKDFQAIVVHASTPAIPPSLLRALRPGGRMVLPIKEEGVERLYLVKRDFQGEILEEALDFCQFVPLIGQEGFPSS